LADDADDADGTNSPGSEGSGSKGGVPPRDAAGTGHAGDQRDEAGVLRDNSGGRLIEQPIEQELKDSYLTYAMSVIVSRALPDVRETYSKLGIATAHSTPARVLEIVKADSPAMGKILKDAGVDPE
jgi:hypothetical protein